MSAYTSNTTVLYYGIAQCPSCRSCFLGKDQGGERFCAKCSVSFPTTY